MNTIHDNLKPQNRIHLLYSYIKKDIELGEKQD